MLLTTRVRIWRKRFKVEDLKGSYEGIDEETLRLLLDDLFLYDEKMRKDERSKRLPADALAEMCGHAVVALMEIHRTASHPHEHKIACRVKKIYSMNSGLPKLRTATAMVRRICVEAMEFFASNDDWAAALCENMKKRGGEAIAASFMTGKKSNFSFAQVLGVMEVTGGDCALDVIFGALEDTRIELGLWQGIPGREPPLGKKGADAVTWRTDLGDVADLGYALGLAEMDDWEDVKEAAVAGRWDDVWSFETMHLPTVANLLGSVICDGSVRPRSRFVNDEYRHRLIVQYLISQDGWDSVQVAKHARLWGNKVLNVVVGSGGVWSWDMCVGYGSGVTLAFGLFVDPDGKFFARRVEREGGRASTVRRENFRVQPPSTDTMEPLVQELEEGRVRTGLLDRLDLWDELIQQCDKVEQLLEAIRDHHIGVKRLGGVSPKQFFTMWNAALKSIGMRSHLGYNHQREIVFRAPPGDLKLPDGPDRLATSLLWEFEKNAVSHFTLNILGLIGGGVRTSKFVCVGMEFHPKFLLWFLSLRLPSGGWKYTNTDFARVKKFIFENPVTAMAFLGGLTGSTGTMEIGGRRLDRFGQMPIGEASQPSYLWDIHVPGRDWGEFLAVEAQELFNTAARMYNYAIPFGQVATFHSTSERVYMPITAGTTAILLELSILHEQQELSLVTMARRRLPRQFLLPVSKMMLLNVSENLIRSPPALADWKTEGVLEAAFDPAAARYPLEVRGLLIDNRHWVSIGLLKDGIVKYAAQMSCSFEVDGPELVAEVVWAFEALKEIDKDRRSWLGAGSDVPQKALSAEGQFDPTWKFWHALRLDPTTSFYGRFVDVGMSHLFLCYTILVGRTRVEKGSAASRRTLRLFFKRAVEARVAEIVIWLNGLDMPRFQLPTLMTWSGLESLRAMPSAAPLVDTAPEDLDYETEDEDEGDVRSEGNELEPMKDAEVKDEEGPQAQPAPPAAALAGLGLLLDVIRDPSVQVEAQAQAQARSPVVEAQVQAPAPFAQDPGIPDHLLATDEQMSPDSDSDSDSDRGSTSPVDSGDGGISAKRAGEPQEPDGRAKRARRSLV